jgi:hypothetical protein
MNNIKTHLRKNSVHLPPEGMELNKSTDTYRRDLVYQWVSCKSGRDLKEIFELENMFALLKGTTEDIIYKRVVERRGEFSKEDLAHFRLLKETLVELHRLKHGEKKVNVNVGYKDIRELMFGDNNKSNQ